MCTYFWRGDTRLASTDGPGQKGASFVETGEYLGDTAM